MRLAGTVVVDEGPCVVVEGPGGVADVVSGGALDVKLCWIVDEGPVGVAAWGPGKVVDVGPCCVVDVGHGGVAGGVADGEDLLGLLMWGLVGLLWDVVGLRMEDLVGVMMWDMVG